MKSVKRVLRGLILLLLIILPVQSASPQTSEKLSEINIAEEYAAGVEALYGHNWPRAIIAFENVVTINRNYRDARAKLERAKRSLESESLKAVLADYYTAGTAAMKKNDLRTALAAFKKIYLSNPDYRDVANRINKIEKLLQDKPATVAKLTAKLDSLYWSAMDFMAEKQWLEAVVNFEKLQLLHPNYRDVSVQLVSAWENLHRTKPAMVEKKINKRWGFDLIGVFVAMILLGAAGYMSFFPASRVRFHQWRGNYQLAAQLCERMIARHPHRIKLYLRLADIYLHLGRNDARAIKVYKAVLQLNLTAANREKINAIVAQNYLTEGRIDSDAITVLEDALRAERRNPGCTNSQI